MITLSFHIALKIAPSSRSSFCSVSSFTASKGEPDKHVPEAGAWTWETQRCFSMTPVSLSSVSLALPSLNRLTLRRAGVRRQDGADRRECHRTAKHLCSSQRSLLSNNSLASVTSRLGLLHSYRSGAGRVSKRQLVKRGPVWNGEQLSVTRASRSMFKQSRPHAAEDTRSSRGPRAEKPSVDR